MHVGLRVWGGQFEEAEAIPVSSAKHWTAERATPKFSSLGT